MYKWVSKQLEAHRVASPAPGPPLVVGISAPQGCGKSTLCEQLVAAFEHEGMCAATVSIDDFYLTHDELEAGAWVIVHGVSGTEAKGVGGEWS